MLAPPGNPNGIELYRRLRAIENLPKVPVVSWRVPDPAAIAEEANLIGAAGYVPYVYDVSVQLLEARDGVLGASAELPCRNLLRPSGGTWLSGVYFRLPAI